MTDETNAAGGGAKTGGESQGVDPSAEEAIAVGDVVVLKSGGPSMTVRDLRDDVAECEWFDGAEHCERAFKIAVLRPIGVTDDPSKIFERMSDAARSVFDDLKERAKGFGR